MEADLACPRCGKPWQEVKDGKLICACGYIRPYIRTYPELLVENVQLKKEVEKLKRKISKLEKRIEELTHNSLETPPNQQQTLLSPRLV